MEQGVGAMSADNGRAAELFPTYARYPITIVKGDGSKLWDDQGTEYLDFSSGLAVTNLGHAFAPVKEALKKQLDELWHVSNLFYTLPQQRLAKLLTEHTCGDLVFLCNSGAEANEAAIKLARRYMQKVRGEDRYEIITFRQSFHGRTLATLTATGQDKVKDGFAPLPAGFYDQAVYNDIESVRAAINDRTCAVLLELVQAEGGVIPADPQFVKELRRLCDERGLLLIFDEVQTGMGRTGSLFAYEQYGVEPDIFTVAKGLGNGFPIGAMLGKAKLREAFGPGSHATTFGGTPIAAAAACAVVEYMVEHRVPEKARQMGEFLINGLRERLEGHPYVQTIRGRGLLIGIVCKGPAADLIASAHNKRLLVVPAGPNVIRLLPNLLVTREEAERAIQILAEVFESQNPEGWNK